MSPQDTQFANLGGIALFQDARSLFVKTIPDTNNNNSELLFLYEELGGSASLLHIKKNLDASQLLNNGTIPDETPNGGANPVWT